MNATSVANWIANLTSDDPVARLEAREHMPPLSGEVVPALEALLYHPDKQVRWESAKALSHVRDERGIGPLIDALEDEDHDVRWAAADALVAHGEPAISPLLRAVIRRSRSVEFCRAAHHVLHELARQRHDQSLHTVMDALDHEEAALHAPVAAWQSLTQRTPGL